MAPLTSIPCRIVLPGMDPDRIEEFQDQKTCFFDTGLGGQVYHLLTKPMGSEDRGGMMRRLKECLKSLDVAMKECSDNKLLEIYLSFARSLGLQHPFRPCKLSNLYRALTKRYYNIAQKEYVTKRIKGTVGDNRTLSELAEGKKHRYNGYRNYPRSVKLPVGKVSSTHWANLQPTSQESFAFGAVNRSEDRSKDDGETRQEISNHGKAGPLWSVDPISPLDFDEIYDILHDDCICGHEYVSFVIYT